jgi:hypothetical protein
MAFEVTDYSRRATLDLATAMATALRRLLLSAELKMPDGTPVRFSEVFEEWPGAEDEYVPPAACVLPGELVYGAAYPTPAPLEDTWEPPGQYGFMLTKVAEAELPIEVEVRTPTQGQRAQVVAALESLFFDRPVGHLGTDSRYGVVVPMPEYFGLPAHFALDRNRKLDDQDRALRNAWETVVRLNAQAPQVVLGRASPFTVSVEEVVGERIAFPPRP